MRVSPDSEEREPTTVKGLSLPTIPLEEKQQAAGIAEPAEPETREVGDWLAQLRTPAVEEVAEPEMVVTEPVEPETAGAEDWLAQLRTSAVEEVAEPEMVAEPVEPEMVAEPVEPEMAGAEDWLAQLRTPAVEEVAEPETVVAEPVEPETAGAEDWLAQLRTPAVEEVAEPEMVAEPIEPVESPDWLRDVGPIGVETEAAPTEERMAIEPPLGEETPAMPPPVPAEVPDRFQETAPATPTLAPAEIPDWLRDIAPPAAKAVPEEAAPAVPTPALPEVPDWLQEAALPEEAAPEAVPEEAVPAPPTSTLIEIPDWLQEAVPPAVEVAPGEAAPAAPALTETPDWLQEAAPPAVEVAPGEAAPAVPALTETPDWLQEAAPPAVEVAPGGAAPAAPALTETPDWLQETAPPAVEVAPGEAAPAAPALAEIPDWLQETAPPAVEVAPGEAAPAAPPLTETPDWLQETAPPAIEVAPGEVAPAAPALAEIPDWLQEAAPPAVEVAPPSSPLFEGVPTLPESEIEAWLTGAQPEAAPPSAPTTPMFEGVPPPSPPKPGIEMAEEGGLVRAEIPDWLEALRPRTETAEAAIEEPLETEGLLEGLRGVLPLAPVIESPPVRETALPAEVSEASLARAQLLQSLLSRPAEMPQPEVRKRGISTSERLQRLIVAAVLLAVVIGMLMWPHMRSEIPTLTLPVGSRAKKVYDIIEGVNVDETVLVAFEYGPAEADELNLVARPILRHLHDQGVDISVASTRPEGVAVAEILRSDIASEGQYTPRYTSLDYRPGGATGVAQILTESGTRPTLILVLAAQPTSLRWWVEQVYALGKDAPPIVAGVSAAVEPVASPYLDANAGQLEGMISGLIGAADYEECRGQRRLATTRLNALTAGHVAIIGLMLGGAVTYTLAGSRGRAE